MNKSEKSRTNAGGSSGVQEGTKDGLTATVINPSYLLTQLNKFLALAGAYVSSDRRKNYGGRNERCMLSEEDEQAAAKLSLFLLRNLPPARQAALTFLAQVLSKEVSEYVHRRRGNNEPEQKNREDSLLGQLESLLSDLVEATPVVWGRLVADWTVKLLGRWAVEWENAVVGRVDATLEELVAEWLSCGPSRTLAGLTITCVTYDPDATVSALLDASSHSGPALDWLVAHVGCSFPATVISRVLSLGLQSFSRPNDRNVRMQKLASVNTILDHLADRHLPDIQRGLLSILMSAFSGKRDENCNAAVPYILKLVSTSRNTAVLTGLTTILPPLLENPKNLVILESQLKYWVPEYFPSNTNILDLVVHLLLDTGSKGAPGLLKILLQWSKQSPISPNITRAINSVLNLLINELTDLAYLKRPVNSKQPQVPLLAGLAGEGRDGPSLQSRSLATSGGSVLPISQLVDWIVLGGEVGDKAVRQVGQFLNLIVLQQGSAASSSLLLHLLHVNKQSLHQNHLHLLITVISAIVRQHVGNNKAANVLPTALATSFQNPIGQNCLLHAINCLEAVIIGGRHHNNSVSIPLTNALLNNVPRLAHLVNVTSVGSAIMQLLGHLPLDRPLPLKHIQILSHATIFYFLNTLQNEDVHSKVSVASQCDRVLSQLSQSSLAHSLLVRLLVEAAFRSEWAHLFGTKEGITLRSKESYEDLLKINSQYDSWVKMPLSHTTVFHAGIIGKGSAGKKLRISSDLSKGTIAFHTQLFLNLLGTCCRAQGSHQGATPVALLLVELISPDIMFNGFPWPEENIKFTFERDLSIKKTFEQFPIAWRLLEIVAKCRPALCYCSILLRALTAAYTAHWNTSPLASSRQAPLDLASTKRLLEIMSIGQFLPGPLSVLPQMVDELAPHEVVCVLQDVWAYLRDHTPSPDRWLPLPNGLHHRPPDPLDSRYTERCRRLIQVHIETLGHLLPAIL